MELADGDFKRYYKYTQGFKEKCEYGEVGNGSYKEEPNRTSWIEEHNPWKEKFTGQF